MCPNAFFSYLKTVWDTTESTHWEESNEKNPIKPKNNKKKMCPTVSQI